MRNYASKSNARVVRYRTPSSFIVRHSPAFRSPPQIGRPSHLGQRGCNRQIDKR